MYSSFKWCRVSGIALLRLFFFPSLPLLLWTNWWRFPPPVFIPILSFSANILASLSHQSSLLVNGFIVHVVHVLQMDLNYVYYVYSIFIIYVFFWGFYLHFFYLVITAMLVLASIIYYLLDIDWISYWPALQLRSFCFLGLHEVLWHLHKYVAKVERTMILEGL